jgi:hypothetical protein
MVTTDGKMKGYAGNSVFATMAGDVGISIFVYLITFCASGQVSAPKPPQRKYANRCAQAAKKVGQWD